MSLIPRRSYLPSINDKKNLSEYANLIFESGFIPDSLIKTGDDKKQTIAKISLVLLKGHELKLSPMQSLQDIFIIKGMPTMYARTMLALIYRDIPMAEIIYDKISKEECIIRARRNKSHAFTTFIYTMKDAITAGNTARNAKNWKQYPKQLLKWRCVSNMSRTLFPDVIMGCYIPEEIGGTITKPNEIDSIDVQYEDTLNYTSTIEVPIEDLKQDNKKPKQKTQKKENVVDAIEIIDDDIEKDLNGIDKDKDKKYKYDDVNGFRYYYEHEDKCMMCGEIKLCNSGSASCWDCDQPKEIKKESKIFDIDLDLDLDLDLDFDDEVVEEKKEELKPNIQSAMDKIHKITKKTSSKKKSSKKTSKKKALKKKKEKIENKLDFEKLRGLNNYGSFSSPDVIQQDLPWNIFKEIIVPIVNTGDENIFNNKIGKIFSQFTIDSTDSETNASNLFDAFEQHFEINLSKKAPNIEKEFILKMNKIIQKIYDVLLTINTDDPSILLHKILTSCKINKDYKNWISDFMLEREWITIDNNKVEILL